MNALEKLQFDFNNEDYIELDNKNGIDKAYTLKTFENNIKGYNPFAFDFQVSDTNFLPKFIYLFKKSKSFGFMG